MPAYIPGELTDLIISYVATDIWVRRYRSLCACALVCRDWLPVSRHYLLKTATANLFIARVVRPEDMRPWLALVSTLILRSPSSKTGIKEPVMTRLPIYELSGRLSHLQSLSLDELDWTVQHPKECLALSQLTSVSSLSLVRCKFPSSATLRHIIAALPSLQTVSIIYCEVPTVAALLPFPMLGSRPALSDLSIHFHPSDGWASAFLGWL